jgi:hypothetical protein
MFEPGSSDELQGQIDELPRRLDTADAERHPLVERTAAADQRADIDREMILELQADGLVSEQHARDLSVALTSSRTIGAAIGILMTSREISADDAFAILRQTSQDTNRKVREIAAEIVGAAAPSESPSS